MHPSKLPRVAAAAALVAAVACQPADEPTGVEQEEPAPLAATPVTAPLPAGILVERSGGLAALATRATVDSATGRFTFVVRRPCAGDRCPAPLDSATGTVPPANVRILFSTVAREHALDLATEQRPTCPRCADQLAYVVTLQTGGTRRTIRTDDAAMPPELARVLDAFWRVIDVERGR